MNYKEHKVKDGVGGQDNGQERLKEVYMSDIRGNRYR